jgi:hypothetical protein
MISALFAAFISTPALAADKLTEDMVRQFYKENIEAMKKPYEEYRTYMDKSFHNNYSSEQTVTLNLPGQPAQKNNITQNKKEVMDFTPEAHEVVRKSEIKHEVKEIKINQDINTAHVIDHTGIKAALESKDGKKLAMATDATCNDVVTLEKGTVQMLQSKCEANTSIEEQKEPIKTGQ